MSIIEKQRESTYRESTYRESTYRESTYGPVYSRSKA
jgi:hypothetical protein